MTDTTSDSNSHSTSDSPEPAFRGDVTVELIKHSAADTDVLWAARVSTAGEQSLDELAKDPERSKGLINYLMRDRHGTPFEHNSMTFFVSAPIFVFREFHRHRVGWCIAGDTEVTTESAEPHGGSTVRKTRIRDLYERWHQQPATRAQQARVLNEETMLFERAPIVDVMQSGVRELITLRAETGEVLRCSKDHAVFTDDGWVKAGDLDPHRLLVTSDGEYVRYERVGGVTEEMTYDLSVAGPWNNFLANGLVVHNSYNEESGRYRELQPVFYVPDHERRLVQRGRPGKYEFVEGTPEQHKTVTEALEGTYRQAYAAYQEMLAAGVAREVARAALPVGLFSSMYATCNARSLMHFIGLRTQHEEARVPSFPQREIEMVAERMEAEWAELMPLTHAAFQKNGRVAP